ncbi:unnamed protein product [Schistosoma intercalatum]|nr:unnamed protein product [Schistosoma intercalatum]CAH8547990.1 unnamed protein product [Schistosoma intercalatum]
MESVSLELLDVLPTSVLLNVFHVKILDQCVICMEKYCIGDEVIRLPCFHAFHDDCFVDWILEAIASRTCSLVCKRLIFRPLNWHLEVFMFNFYQYTVLTNRE